MTSVAYLREKCFGQIEQRNLPVVRSATNFSMAKHKSVKKRSYE